MTLVKKAAPVLYGLVLFSSRSVAVEILRAGSSPEWDQLFQQSSGWIGADGAFSAPLTNDTTVWLFSDTFVGEIKNGRRANAVMINNSIALQHGTNPPVFFYGRTADGKPDSFVKRKDGRGYSWFFQGPRTSEGLWLFFHQFVIEHPDTPFGFKLVG